MAFNFQWHLAFKPIHNCISTYLRKEVIVSKSGKEVLKVAMVHYDEDFDKDELSIDTSRWFKNPTKVLLFEITMKHLPILILQRHIQRGTILFY